MTTNDNWRGAVEMVKRSLTKKGRQQTGLYSIEGIRLHERALHANLSLELVILADSFAQTDSVRGQQLLANLPPTPCYFVPDAVMAELSNGRNLGQLIGLLKIPPAAKLQECVTAVNHPLLLILANVIDPGNVGAMIRTAHAHGAAAVILLGQSDPYHPKAVRTSMGSLFKTAVCPYNNIESILADLQQLGIETVGTVSGQGTLLPETTFARGGTAVFMGNEYFGLPEDFLKRLDRQVTIPMASGIDSLSVNAATAVILYEIHRQQHHLASPGE
ncbi:MAG: RNA methyltransferase [Chloroflexi bacterium]|nr:RNA methyltransferase [Chloroflexota bacterium]